jgi:hypothetical protein
VAYVKVVHGGHGIQDCLFNNALQFVSILFKCFAARYGRNLPTRELPDQKEHEFLQRHSGESVHRISINRDGRFNTENEGSGWMSREFKISNAWWIFAMPTAFDFCF